MSLLPVPDAKADQLPPALVFAQRGLHLHQSAVQRQLFRPQRTHPHRQPVRAARCQPLPAARTHPQAAQAGAGGVEKRPPAVRVSGQTFGTVASGKEPRLNLLHLEDLHKHDGTV